MSSMWISVRDRERLPKKGESVLCFDAWTRSVGTGHYIGRDDDYGVPRFVLVESDDVFITAWKPIGGLPVVDDDGWPIARNDAK
jgi:hypothetical protein